MTKTNISSFITSFLKLESAGGILLFIAAVLAIIFVNSPLEPIYNLLLTTPVAVQVGALEVAKPLLLWINDGLMVLFFFLVGLELKRELLEGELSDKNQIILPGIGAVGGMLVPALIYLYFNANDPVAAKGWAIPAATDIAFALGVLSLMGSKVPVSIKIFLTSLAIFDDIGAILIIALFYTSHISFLSLLVVLGCAAVLYAFNRRNITEKSLYIFVGAIMWLALLKSGVHATLAGVLLAMFIPMYSKKDTQYSPLKTLEYDLHSVVALIVLPVFAFANAGIALGGLTIDQVLHPVTMGVAMGLFLGKQIGIFGLCWLLVTWRWVKLPKDFNMLSLYGVSALCGIGFTMSLFIGSLAFEETGVNLLFDERLGIIIGSLLSGIVGYSFLRAGLRK